MGCEALNSFYPFLARDARPWDAQSAAPRFHEAASQEIAAVAWAVKQGHQHQPFQAAVSTALPKLQTFTAPRDGKLAVALDGAVGVWDRGVKNYEAAAPTLLRLVEGIVSRQHFARPYASSF